jgi:hypothetical protein
VPGHPPIALDDRGLTTFAVAGLHAIANEQHDRDRDERHRCDDQRLAPLLASPRAPARLDEAAGSGRERRQVDTLELGQLARPPQEIARAGEALPLGGRGLDAPPDDAPLAVVVEPAAERVPACQQRLVG